MITILSSIPVSSHAGKGFTFHNGNHAEYKDRSVRNHNSLTINKTEPYDPLIPKYPPRNKRRNWSEEKSLEHFCQEQRKAYYAARRDKRKKAERAARISYNFECYDPLTGERKQVQRYRN